MSRLPDLVLDSRLRTRFQGSITVHSYLEIDETNGRFRREEHWKKEQFLGRGGFGQVRLESCVTSGPRKDAVRAVKIINKPVNTSESVDFNRELEAIAKFSNDRYKRWFVKSFGWYDDATSIFIAMEYCRHGDLHHCLLRQRTLPTGHVQQLTYQILEGLDQMHQNGYAHRDLKPSNILIKSMPPDEKWWVVLADFGISKRADEGNGRTTRIGGTDGYKAPELLGLPGFQKPKYAADFKPADLWALGEIVFRMLTGEPTFEPGWKLFEHCQKQNPFPSDRLPASAGDDCREFVVGIMETFPEQRMTTAQCLKHGWIESLRAEEELPALQTAQMDAQESDVSAWSDSASARWSDLSTREDEKTSRQSLRGATKEFDVTKRRSSHQKAVILSTREPPVEPPNQFEHLNLHGPNREVANETGHTTVRSRNDMVPARQAPVLTAVSGSVNATFKQDRDAVVLTLENLLNDVEGLTNEVATVLVRNLSPPLASRPPPSKHDVLFPAYLINLTVSEMWYNSSLEASEMFLAKTMQSIQQRMMEQEAVQNDSDESINLGAFWISNVHEILSFVFLAEDFHKQQNFKGYKFDRLIEIVIHDLESLEFNIYHFWMQILKKRMHKLIIPAIIESQSLGGSITKKKNRFLGKLLPSSSAVTVDHLLGLLDGIYQAAKAYHLEDSIISQVVTELLRLVGVTSFNDLLARKQLLSWKLGLEISSNLARVEEWCESHDLLEGTVQLEHISQASKLLQLTKGQLKDVEIVEDVFWVLSQKQIQKLLSQCTCADDGRPVNAEFMKHLASRVEEGDVLFLEPVDMRDSGSYEVAEPRAIPALETYSPSWLQVPKLKQLAQLVSDQAVAQNELAGRKGA